MSAHEDKQCTRCSGMFECKPLDISHCHCSLIQLNDAERSYIQSRYDDCLCHDCLKALKQEAYLEQLNQFKKRTPLG
jgi:hypothetical protein